MKDHNEAERKHRELKESILAYLQRTSFTEPQLAELHKIDTRTIRKTIGEMVAEGQPIVNLGRGFFLSSDPEIIEAKSKKDNALICGSSAREIRDASRVLSGLVFLSKTLRDKQNRNLIYSPVNPNFDVIFLADAEGFYHYQLSLKVPTV